MKKEDIYEEYASMIYKYLYLQTNDYNLSEKLTQEVFYQAMRTLKNFKGESKVSTWLCQIAKNCWYKYLDKKTKNNHINLEAMQTEISDDSNPEKIVLATEDRVFLYRQIHSLKEPYREIVLLRTLGNLSFKEIGEIMDKNENWARVTFHRAKIIMIERGKLNEK